MKDNQMKTLIMTALIATFATAPFAHTALGDKELKVHSLKVIGGFTTAVIDTSHQATDTELHCVFFDANGIPVGTSPAYTTPIATTVILLDASASVKCLAV